MTSRNLNALLNVDEKVEAESRNLIHSKGGLQSRVPQLRWKLLLTGMSVLVTNAPWSRLPSSKAAAHSTPLYLTFCTKIDHANNGFHHRPHTVLIQRKISCWSSTLPFTHHACLVNVCIFWWHSPHGYFSFFPYPIAISHDIAQLGI
jgi:hypothetical protein